MTGKKIYMDNAATTAVSDEVLSAMLPFLKEDYGNASALYDLGMRSKRAIDNARKQCAALIGADDREIFFTGCGTEADNWVLISCAEKHADKGRHIITSAIEHHAVLNTCEYLSKKGFEITCLPVDERGRIDPVSLEKNIRKDTILVSIMTANNEVGTIEPVRECGRIAKEHGVMFHTDAVQAYGHITIDVNVDNIDMLSASAHKLNGPKGVGFLYVRRGYMLPSFLHGGSQERGHRAGTENVAGIVGFGMAAECALRDMKKNMENVSTLRDHMLKRITDEISSVTLTGDPDDRLPNNISLLVDGIEGGSLVYALSREGVYASAASACSSGTSEPSHVLKAMGVSHEKAFGSLRLTLSHFTTKEEADECVDILKKVLEGKK